MANSNHVLRTSWSARIFPPPNTDLSTATGQQSASINYSRDDLDTKLCNGEISKKFLSYYAHIPPISDNHPMDTISARLQEQYVSNSLFTGGFNSVTRAQLMNRVIESETSHPQMAGAKGSSCAVHGCNANVTSDERGNDILPCECNYKICHECFSEGRICHGCKEPYREIGVDEMLANRMKNSQSKMERRLSLMKSMKEGMSLSRSQIGEFETNGTYGYGNAIWPKESNGDGDGEQTADLVIKPWRPLSMKVKIPAAVLSPYRYECTGVREYGMLSRSACRAPGVLVIDMHNKEEGLQMNLSYLYEDISSGSEGGAVIGLE